MYKFPKNWHFLPSYVHTYMWKMLISIKNFAYVREDPFRNANWWWLGKCSYNDASKKCKTNNDLLVLWSVFSVSMMIWSTVGILACLFSFFFQFFDKYHYFLAFVFETKFRVFYDITSKISNEFLFGLFLLTSYVVLDDDFE